MLLAIGKTVIMPSIDAEPLHLFPEVSMAEIAFAGGYLPVCKSLCLAVKFSGNILHVGIKLYLYFRFSVHRRVEYIKGNPRQHLMLFPENLPENFCCINSIPNRTVKGCILL